MRDAQMRFLLLLSSISIFECAPAGSFDGFSPERVGIRGYVGFTTRKEVELRLNGQPLEKGGIQFSPPQSGDNEFELLVAPLTGNVLLAFTPQKTGLVSSRLPFSYRGSSYSILVIGNGVEAPKCRSSSNICVEYLFNSDSEQCEPVLHDGRRCEAFDCMNPGTCTAGECIHHETPHATPWCSRIDAPTPLTPVWTYSPNPPAPIIAPLHIDEEGNSYLLEGYPNTLVSLDASGRTRWRTSDVATSIVDEDSASVSFQFSADELFVVDEWSNKLSAVRRTDGTLLWDRIGWGYESTVLPVGDSLWALDFIDGLKLALNVYDPVTGELRRKIAEPLTLDGTECRFADIAGGTDGRVYLTTSDSHGVRDQDAVLVALDVATGDPVWSTRFPYYSIQWARFSALVGTMLIYDNGTVVDLASQAVFQNEKQWLSFQANPGTAQFIQADGTGFESQLEVFDGCEVKNLSRTHVVEGTKDWTCLIGTHRLAGGLLGLTPKGSAIVLGFKAETLDGQSVQRPIITIIRPEGDVAFSGKLMLDPLSLTLPAVVAIRGSRLLVRQASLEAETHSIVAYDILELVTQ